MAAVDTKTGMKTIENTTKPATTVRQENWLETVKIQVGSLRFGVVQIVVHDAHVVQIEKTEKIRFDKSETFNQNRPIVGG